MKLTIELIPKTSFYTNLRSILSRKEWSDIRIDTLIKANHRCEICGGESYNRALDCHEVWIFDDENHIQKLIKIIALCDQCHEVKHIGLAQVKGNFDRARKHFMKINNINYLEANKIINEAFYIWEQRSQYKWQLDITILKMSGVNRYE